MLSGPKALPTKRALFLSNFPVNNFLQPTAVPRTTLNPFLSNVFLPLTIPCLLMLYAPGYDSVGFRTSALRTPDGTVL